MGTIPTTPAQRASTRTPNDWNALYRRSVLPQLTSADVTWLATVDTILSPLPLNTAERDDLIADVRLFLAIGGGQ